MNDPVEPSPPPAPAPIPQVVVRRQTRIPLIWAIPIVAALVAGSLWVKALRERGHEITIQFATGEGLEPGKTKIKTRDVELGTVSSVKLRRNLSGVVVTADMAPASEEFLVDATRFWVVRPRVGRGGVSGLGTLVSGAYIEIDPSLTGTPTHAFVGLEAPPQTPVNAPGLKIELRAERLGSLGVGSAVFHRQIEVGHIESQNWGEGFESVLFDVYIEQPYSGLIRANTRFWNTSGVSVALGADGLEVKAESLDSLLAGGVSFALPHDHLPGPPATPGDAFKLYDDERAAMEDFEDTQTYVLHFGESVRGLSVGAPVEFGGVRVGTVRSIDPVYDRESLQLRIPVLIDVEPERFDVLGGAEPLLDLEERRANLEGLVAKGLRARLETGNLLTGSLFVSFGDFAESEVRLMGSSDPEVLEIPTIPSSTAALGETLAQLPQVMAGLQASLDGAAALLGSQQLASTLASIDGMAADLAVLSDVLEQSAPSLLDRIDGALAQLETSLSGLSGASDAAGRELTLALRDLSATLRSLRNLADYIERHPEALLHGKDVP